MTDDGKGQRRPRGRPRNTVSKRPVTTLLMEDVDAWLKQTQSQTGMPLNIIVNAIIRGYYIQRHHMINMPPQPDPYSDVLLVPIMPVYEVQPINNGETTNE